MRAGVDLEFYLNFPNVKLIFLYPCFQPGDGGILGAQEMMVLVTSQGLSSAMRLALLLWVSVLLGATGPYTPQAVVSVCQHSTWLGANKYLVSEWGSR